VARSPSPRTYARKLLDADALLPVESPYRMTNAQRLQLMEIMAKQIKPGPPKNTKPSNTGKIKKPSRNFSEADIARLRGTSTAKPAEKKAETLGEFLIEEKKDATE